MSQDEQVNADANKMKTTSSLLIYTLADFAKCANYSLLDFLVPDAAANDNKPNREPRPIRSGHYVPLDPTPLPQPELVAHSPKFFAELGLADTLANSPDFVSLFSGDISVMPTNNGGRKIGWASGYALSIMGQEYYTQDGLGGNGYGDGRAVSVFEGVFGSVNNSKRWEFQLKGGGKTPYCRGADGRAVLRSSIREFLAQEAMAALGVPTSRSLSLFVSKQETVKRPWYSDGSKSEDPDQMVVEPVAISTRVAPSFLRVGQIELFGRRARKNEHPDAKKELAMIVQHAIDREYPELNKTKNEQDTTSVAALTSYKILAFARSFRTRIASLVSNWIRVGFTQGNFNADNTAVGGWTLDYGPFGFLDVASSNFQSWTGGGEHFAFGNQPAAAERNFGMLCLALKQLFVEGKDDDAIAELATIMRGFAREMNETHAKTMAGKMGLDAFRPQLYAEMNTLMEQTPVDYTIFFRELSSLPTSVAQIESSFYDGDSRKVFSSLNNGPSPVPKHATFFSEPHKIRAKWTAWLEQWNAALAEEGKERSAVSKEMKRVNPKYILREWMMQPAYKAASATGNYALVKELYEVATNPYAEQSEEIERKYYQKKALSLFGVGGVSHCSCSS